MLKVTKAFITMALILACTVSVDAAEKGAKKKKGKKTGVRIQALNLPATIELSAEQKEQVASLKKEYTPQFAALQKKFRGILTEEQRSARREAMKEAKDAGKKGKELRSAVNSALKLSDEQSKQMKEAAKESKELNAEVRGKLSKILTADQLAKIKKRGKGTKKKKKNT